MRQKYDERDWRINRWIYHRLTEQVDRHIGTILDGLADAGLEDDTLILFVSDHGNMDASHRLASKGFFYEESVRVPFLMRLPGAIEAGTRIDSAVSTRDIFPTVLDYLGQPPRDGINSESLRPVIEGREVRDVVVAEWREDSKVPTYMIRSGDWKLLISKLPDADSIDALYNLADDPHELHNLLYENMPESHARIAAELKKKLAQWLENANSPSVQGVRDRQLPAATSR